MPEVAEEIVEEVAEEKVEVPEGFIPLENHQKDVNVQHKRFRDEERARIALEEKYNAAQKRLEELESKVSEVVIPPVPDPYSENFQAEVEARDAAIAAAARKQTADELAEQKRKEQAVAKQTEESAALEQRVAKFDSNLVSHGLDAAEVKSAAEAVISYGISTTFQDVLLDDKDGPLMVKYLQANPIEAEQINNMSTLALVKYLDSDVRPKALLLKPQTSTAPNPPITLEGGGAPETKEAWERGAKYE
jgi:hypothetical protein